MRADPIESRGGIRMHRKCGEWMMMDFWDPEKLLRRIKNAIHL